MNRHTFVVVLMLAFPVVGIAQTSGRFTKQTLSTGYFCDGIHHGDFDRDGKTDIVAGPYWYAGPEFRAKHAFYKPVALPPEKSPSNSMFSYVHDFDGDGWDDILVLGRVHLHQAFWYENPQGKAQLWKKHLVFHRVQGESPPFIDVDGDGQPELVSMWENRWGFLQPDPKKPTEPWKFRPVTPTGKYNHFYHGTGVGDINGDGRLDLLLNEGWWEQPADSKKLWTLHPFRFGKRGGAQMFAYDIDGDGDNDIVTALDGHGWGLAWFEQTRDKGKVSFVEHRIMGDRSEEKKFGVAFSQPHALEVADIDGDGLQDIIVGKRRWAHGPSGDVEPNAEPVVYWFQLVREVGKPVKFVPHKIDAESGVGVQIDVADVNGDGAVDVLTASKLGTFVFLNQKK